MARRALVVAALVIALFAALALVGCGQRVLVCVSGWMAEDNGLRLRMIRRDGSFVPCLTPTGSSPNRGENEASAERGAENPGVVLTRFAGLDDKARKNS